VGACYEKIYLFAGAILQQLLPPSVRPSAGMSFQSAGDVPPKAWMDS
jgi:hypothetical protein